MLSKLKIVCALEAEGLLQEPIHRRHWVHPFNSERESSERFETFESMTKSFLDITGCHKTRSTNCLKY
jgi:hypothetical protein